MKTVSKKKSVWLCRNFAQKEGKHEFSMCGGGSLALFYLSDTVVIQWRCCGSEEPISDQLNLFGEVGGRRVCTTLPPATLSQKNTDPQVVIKLSVVC